jgi:hypothetical protein
MKIKVTDGIYRIENNNGSIVGFFKTLEIAERRLQKDKLRNKKK